MRTQFKKIIERFEVLSLLANQESEHSKEIILGKNNLGLSFGSPEHLQLQKEPTPCNSALEAFLKALPDSNVLALCNLMYAGRDNVNSPSEFKKDISNKEEAIISILEKTPRADYISTALSKLTTDEEVNQFPAKFIIS